MGYKVIYDNGQIIIKRVILWQRLSEGVSLGVWYDTKKKGKYYLLTNYSVDLNRINKLINQLKVKIDMRKKEKEYFDKLERMFNAYNS